MMAVSSSSIVRLYPTASVLRIEVSLCLKSSGLIELLPKNTKAPKGHKNPLEAFLKVTFFKPFLMGPPESSPRSIPITADPCEAGI